MDYRDLEVKSRKKLYNRCAYIWKRYGIRIGPLELFLHLKKIGNQRLGKRRPVLTSEDDSWELNTLCWREYCEIRQPNWRAGLIRGIKKDDASYSQLGTWED